MRIDRTLFVLLVAALELLGAVAVNAAPDFTPMYPPAALKSSDIFFAPIQTGCVESPVYANDKEAPFIIAREIEIRGWLVGPVNPSHEDAHYDFVPDFDWILDRNS